MLVITRRPGEKIVIDRFIEVTVLSVNGNQVRVGVAAPRSVTVNRYEIEQLKSQKADSLIEGKK